MKNYLFLALILLTILAGCSNVSDELLREAHKAAGNGALIIDVRTPEEFKSKHIKGAVNIPLQILGKAYGRIDKNKELIVYCRSGNRSATATKFLRKKGWTVYDVATQSDWERNVSQQ